MWPLNPHDVIKMTRLTNGTVLLPLQCFLVDVFMLLLLPLLVNGQWLRWLARDSQFLPRPFFPDTEKKSWRGAQSRWVPITFFLAPLKMLPYNPPPFLPNPPTDLWSPTDRSPSLAPSKPADPLLRLAREQSPFLGPSDHLAQVKNSFILPSYSHANGVSEIRT